MLDSDLAKLYRVTTSNLNLAVKRNLERFPKDFIFRLTEEEYENLRLQFAISSLDTEEGAIYVCFTEHGVAMVSAVLRSEMAVAMSVSSFVPSFNCVNHWQ